MYIALQKKKHVQYEQNLMNQKKAKILKIHKLAFSVCCASRVYISVINCICVMVELNVCVVCTISQRWVFLYMPNILINLYTRYTLIHGFFYLYTTRFEFIARVLSMYTFFFLLFVKFNE